MKYETMSVFYLTGTGNSQQVACWVAEQAESLGITGNTVAAESMGAEDAGREVTGQLIGLVFPAHGFTAPWHVIRFVLSLPRADKCHAFVMVARGATRYFQRWILPGMEGTAGYLIALMLALKGYTVRGVTGIDMPSNWTALHSALKTENVAAILERGKQQAQKCMDIVLAGKGRYFNGISCLLTGLALLRVSIMYLLLARFLFAKLFFASNACTGCGSCVRNCPIGAVIMLGDSRSRPYWKFSCESCMRCMANCPEQAVEAGHSLGALLYFISAIPVSVWLFKYLTGMFPEWEWLQAGWTGGIVQYVYVLSSLWVSYRVFHRLIQFPWVNTLFTWTTLTHFYNRYHGPGGVGKSNSSLRTLK